MMKRIGELKAEVERLKMEQRLKAVPVEAKLMDCVAELKAEVERLTKAGDRVLHVLLWTDEYDEFRYKDAKKIWNDAKKGGQP
jgi:phage host-nuclease inhibitor protein Gam